MKPYKVTDLIERGKPKKRIRLYDNSKLMLELRFESQDLDKNLRKADMFILKYNLKYETKKLKPLNK